MVHEIGRSFKGTKANEIEFFIIYPELIDAIRYEHSQEDFKLIKSHINIRISKQNKLSKHCKNIRKPVRIFNTKD